MVQTAETDIIGPAVAAEDPDGRAGLAVAGGLAGSLQALHMLQHGRGVVAELRLALGALQERDAFLYGQHAVLQRGNILIGGGRIQLAVLHSVQPFLRSGLQVGQRVLNSNQRTGLVGQALADRRLRVYGDVAAGPPQMDEQPVALEIYIRSPYNWVIRRA